MAKRKVQKPQSGNKSNKKINSIFIWLGVLLIMALFGWYVAHVWKLQREEAKADAAIYVAFGVDMPHNYYIHGIDVSSFQNSIAWKKVASMKVNNVRMGFAYIKATEGLGNVDENFRKNYTNAKRAGIICGAYHFFLPTKSGTVQAANFVRTVQLSIGDLPPVVDIEQLYGVPPLMMRKRLKECLDAMEIVYKTKPILYSNVDFYEKYLGSEFNDYPLWVAHYDEPEKPRTVREWLFWQHSESGHVNGIATKVDFSVFNGDSTAFQKLRLH